MPVLPTESVGVAAPIAYSRYVLDVDNVIVKVDERLERFTGYTAPPIIHSEVMPMLTLQILPQPLTVCKVEDLAGFSMAGLYFIGSTDAELSLVCETDRAPANTTAREDDWRAMRIAGTLDFSLTGILSGIAAILADEKIGIFAISTYDTDYILVKAEDLDRAVGTLKREGYKFGFVGGLRQRNVSEEAQAQRSFLRHA